MRYGGTGVWDFGTPEDNRVNAFMRSSLGIACATSAVIYVNMGVSKGSQLLNQLGPLTRRDLVTVYRGYFNDRNNDSDTPAHEWREFVDGENRDVTARGTPSSSAWWRSAAPTMTE